MNKNLKFGKIVIGEGGTEIIQLRYIILSVYYLKHITVFSIPCKVAIFCLTLEYVIVFENKK